MFAPHLTVAAIVEKSGKFLLVEEWVDGEPHFNQPAGHIEDNETVIEALQRETREETGIDVSATGLVGLYQWKNRKGETFFRYAFSTQIILEQANPKLDPDIIRTHWLSREEIITLQQEDKLRSPLVIACIDDYLAAEPAPLTLIKQVS